MKFILGQKKQMTQVFQDDGTVVPVTVIKAEPNTITAVKNTEKDGYLAVQMAWGNRKAKRVKMPQREALKDLNVTPKKLREFRVESIEGKERGQKVDVTLFEVGETVRVTGTSKGRGYAGVVKRHHFKGGPATHGHKDNLRAPGSIGATFPQHVMKGTRMAGRMGNERVTLTGLKVVKVVPEANELWISGAVPGAFNGFVMVSTKSMK